MILRMGGCKTRSMFDRWTVVDESDLGPSGRRIWPGSRRRPEGPCPHGATWVSEMPWISRGRRGGAITDALFLALDPRSSGIVVTW